MFRQMKNKAGVSLVVVLLLMLVATIAATATYKWLNSSGRTSSSRMLQNMAYQSAVAGIENTRTWMTYHASDVGALIKQYLSGKNKPILLNPQLKELTRTGQDFDVWLVGVNTEHSTYKLKLLSSGKAANNTEYNLAAILNVDGLYRVKIPQVNTSSKLNFDYAYFASTYHGAGDVTMQSAVINGNWSGNPQSVTGNLIVTGNATLSGNNVNVGELACIGGNMTIGNQGIVAKDLYVHGASTNARMTVNGDAYFDGPITQGSTGSLNFKGNVTLNSTMNTAQNAGDYWVKIAKNMCLTESAMIRSGGINADFEVVGNVWMPGKTNVVYKDFEDNSGTYNQVGLYSHIILGSSTDSKAYIKYGRAYDSYSQFNTQSYTETGKRNCPTRFSIFEEDGTTAKYNWISQPDGHFKKAENANDKYVCGTVSSESDPRKPHNYNTYQYVDYTMGWVDWSGSSHSGIFPTVPSGEGKYYMSDYSGAASGFVTFAQETLTDWKKYEGLNDYDLVVDSENKIFGVPVYVGGDNNFGARFTENPEVGLYKIKGTPYYDPTTNGNNFYNYVGNKPTGAPYCYYDGTSEGAYRPACKMPVWFKSNATVSATMDEDNKPQCAEDVLDHCNQIWEPTENGCDNSKFRVKDPLSTGYKNFKDFATAGCAAGITKWSDMSKATTCYDHNEADDDLKRDSLYNGYLVIKLTDGGGENCNNYSLKGKFIIIADEKISCQNGLPKTTDDSFVFMYLTKGAAKIGSTNKHYFIYTLGQIDDMPGGPKLTGTLYAPVSLCKGVGTIQSATFTVDKPLLDDLAANAVICNNDGSDPTCTYGVDYGGSSSSGAGGSSSSGGGVEIQEIQLGGTDGYYISNAPTLSVSIETQYKTDEPLPSASQSSNIDQDFIVVPRVIYMPTDPYGTLDDYYNVIGLNGLQLSKSDGSVSCTGPTTLKTSGPLYNHAGGDTKLANNGRYKCTFTARGKSVPFYIIAKGESGNTPFISFTEQFVKMGGTGSHEVQIRVPAHAATLTVKILKPSNIDHWTISPNGGTCTGNECTFNLSASSTYEDVPVFTVSTSNATSGTATFQLDAGTGYIIEPPSTVTLSLSSAITVNRENVTSEQLDAFCSGNDECPANTSQWPDCPTTSSWVKATPNCYTETTNWSWSCGVADDVMLAETTPPAGCLVIIPPGEKIALADITNGGTYPLHASLKAKLLPFYFGFAGINIAGKTITATITTSTDAGRVGTNSTCTYGTSITATNQRCVLNVFSGERVEVRVSGATRPENFNYWSCSGNNCPVEVNSGMVFPQFAVTSNNNNVVAHFDESDKHCFFDEFNTGVGCTSAYCIGPTGTKWRSADGAKLDYKDGYVSVLNDRQDNTGAVVMSTADVGLVGTLKAQFLVPQAPKSGKTELPEKIKNTGFMLRSNSAGTVYLLMNVYVDKDGYLAVRICDETGNNCRTKNPMDASSRLQLSSSTIVTMTVDLSLNNIVVGAMTDRLGTSANYTASFTFSDGIGNYKETGSNMGFRIADPMFKLYDIGWQSETFGSKCWDTPPTVNCSFRSAYAGGYVPLNQHVTPWVGLSSWFDTRDCAPHYYYMGDDANCGSSVAYGECVSGYYQFSEPGVHGVPDANDVDVRTAKAGVGNCYYLDNKDALLAATAWGHCGAFWVGELTPCSQHAYFVGTGSDNDPATIYAGSQESFNLDAGVSVREASLVVNLTNSDNATVEIVLKSQETSSAPVYYSRPFITTASGEMTVDIQSMIDIENLDPQDIFGVDVRVLGTQGTVTVNSIYTSCPNVPSITCGQNMKYNTLTGKWEVEATATPFSKVKTLTVGEKNSYLSSHTYDCSNSECNYIENGKMATYTFEYEDNPYKVDPPRTGSSYPYTFTVNMTTNDTPNPISLSCETNAWSVPEIQGTCGSISTAKVKAGLGLPQFNYDVSNCPESGCTYKIVLSNTDETLIKSSTGNVVNGATASDAANTASAPLAVGTYKFKLVSTDVNAPFVGCESEQSFQVVDLASDYDVTCGVSKQNCNGWGDCTASASEFFTTDHLYFVAKNNVRTGDQITGLTVYKDNTSQGTASITNWSNWSTTKDIGTLAAGTYTYSLKIANSVICTKEITITDPGDDVTAICYSGTAYINQSTGNLISMSNYGNLETEISRTIKVGSEVKATSVCSKNNCSADMEFTAPGTVGEVKYDFYLGDDKKCSGTLNVIDPVSEVTATCVPNVSTYPGQSVSNLVTLSNHSHVVTQVPLTIKIGTSTKSSNTCDQYNCPNGPMAAFNAPTELGEHTYTLYVNGISKCSGKITVNNVLSCSAPTNVTLGNSFTFTTTYASDCWTSTLTSNSAGNGLPNNITPCQQSYTITPTSVGTKTYTYSVTNGRVGTGSCTVNVTASEVTPTATCPTTALSVENGSSTTFTPTTVTGCTSPASCSYSITKGSFTSSGSNYHGGATNSFTPTEAGDYTFTVTNTAGSASCTFPVEFKAPTLTCSNTTVSVEPTGTVSFGATVNYCSSCEYSVTKDGTVVSDASPGLSSGTASFTSEAQKGKITYRFSAKNSANLADYCDVEVTYLAPTLTCPDDPYSVEPGTNVPFIPATFGNCSKGCNYSLVYRADASNYHWENSTNWSYTTKSQVPFPRAAGLSNSDYNYSFTVTNRGGGSASCNFSVKDAVPTVTCPDDMEKATSASVTVTPKTVTNCTRGCKYKVTKETASGTAVITEPPTYSYIVSSGGTPGSLGDGFTGESNASGSSGIDYYITLTNPGGAGTACKFNVVYKSASDLCHCSETCPSANCGSNLKTSGSFAWDGNCYFVRTFNHVHSGDGNDYIINGVSLTAYSNVYTENFPDKVDGGYYIWAPSYGTDPSGSSVVLGEATCGGSAGGSGSPIDPGAELVAGTYRVSGWTEAWCGEPTTIKVQETTNGNKSDCLDWVTGSSKSYSQHDQYNCVGTLTISYPFDVNIPTGKVLKFYCN